MYCTVLRKLIFAAANAANNDSNKMCQSSNIIGVQDVWRSKFNLRRLWRGSMMLRGSRALKKRLGRWDGIVQWTGHGVKRKRQARRQWMVHRLRSSAMNEHFGIGDWDLEERTGDWEEGWCWDNITGMMYGGRKREKDTQNFISQSRLLPMEKPENTYPGIHVTVRRRVMMAHAMISTLATQQQATSSCWEFV